MSRERVTQFRGYSMIIGAMKCGTTTLHRTLRTHPQLTAGRKKEPQYFCYTSNPLPADYQAIFPDLDKRVHAYTLDGSIGYSKVSI